MVLHACVELSVHVSSAMQTKKTKTKQTKMTANDIAIYKS